MLRLVFVLALALLVEAQQTPVQIIQSHNIEPSPAGGMEVRNTVAAAFGNEKTNIVASATKVENTLPARPLSINTALEANSHGHSVGIEHSKTSAIGTALTEKANVNLLKTNLNTLNAHVFHTQEHFVDAPTLTKVGGGLNYQHAGGHGATITAMHVPQLRANAVDLSGKANLWTSPSKQSTLDAHAGATHWINGPMHGRTYPYGGIMFRRRF